MEKPKITNTKECQAPNIDKRFSSIAEKEHFYWQFEAHADPARGPKPNTITARTQRLNRIKAFFGEQTIDTIHTAQAAQFYDSIQSPHEYQKMRYILASIFQFARAKGMFPDHIVNPGQAAQLRRIPRPTQRHSMTAEQFQAIYKESPEWIQIAMDIILQTALRQQDIWKLTWQDIKQNYLHVTPEKSHTMLRKGQKASHLKFGTNKNTRLKSALGRARTAKEKLETNDCPYIIFRTNAKRLKNGTTKMHPLQITRTFAAHEFKKARNKAIKNSTAFTGLKPEEMPAFHGIRKLSLQMMRTAGATNDYLQVIAGHQDFKLTEEKYLNTGKAEWIECDKYEVEL